MSAAFINECYRARDIEIFYCFYILKMRQRVIGDEYGLSESRVKHIIAGLKRGGERESMFAELMGPTAGRVGALVARDGRQSHPSERRPYPQCAPP